MSIVKFVGKFHNLVSFSLVRKSLPSQHSQACECEFSWEMTWTYRARFVNSPHTSSMLKAFSLSPFSIYMINNRQKNCVYAFASFLRPARLLVCRAISHRRHIHILLWFHVRVCLRFESTERLSLSFSAHNRRRHSLNVNFIFAIKHTNWRTLLCTQNCELDFSISRIYYCSQRSEALCQAGGRLKSSEILRFTRHSESTKRENDDDEAGESL